jgi:hypothetical protein
MSHEELQELLGAYALDAVDNDERTEIEDHLRTCARCRAEVGEHRETAAFLAHAGADAPPAVWDAIAGAIETPNVVPIDAPRLGERRRRNPWPAAVAVVGAAASIVIGLLVVEVRDQDRRIDRVQQASDPFAEAIGVRGAKVVHLNAGDTELPVVLTPDGKAYLQAASLPELADGRTYQLWGRAGDELVSVAVLGRDPDVVSFDVAGFAALAITEERAPGVVRSRNTPVASGEVT